MENQADFKTIIERIAAAVRRARAGDLAAQVQSTQDLGRLRELPPTETIRGYQALRERGVLDIASANCLILYVAEQLAGERARSALGRYPEALAEDEGEAVYDMHMAQVLREHGEAQLAEIWEDPEQRNQLFAEMRALGDDWRPPHPN